MDTNDYTGVPKSAMVQAAEDAARIAQLQRDVAHWRRRAEGAEQMSAQQEIRLARADGALVDTNDYTGVPKSPSVLAAEYAARIARLEKVLARDRGCAECWKGASCGTDCRMNDVLEGRDA